MPSGDLGTTNLLLGILAAVSVLEALGILVVGVMGYRVYRQITRTISEMEARHVAPLATRVDQILSDVKAITARVNGQVARVDEALTETFERVDETADRLRTGVRQKVRRVISIGRGVRAALESVLTAESWRRATPAPGR